MKNIISVETLDEYLRKGGELISGINNKYQAGMFSERPQIGEFNPSGEWSFEGYQRFWFESTDGRLASFEMEPGIIEAGRYFLTIMDELGKVIKVVELIIEPPAVEPDFAARLGIASDR